MSRNATETKTGIVTAPGWRGVVLAAALAAAAIAVPAAAAGSAPGFLRHALDRTAGSNGQMIASGGEQMMDIGQMREMMERPEVERMMQGSEMMGMPSPAKMLESMTAVGAGMEGMEMEGSGSMDMGTGGMGSSGGMGPMPSDGS